MQTLAVRIYSVFFILSAANKVVTVMIVLTDAHCEGDESAVCECIAVVPCELNDLSL